MEMLWYQTICRDEEIEGLDLKIYGVGWIIKWIGVGWRGVEEIMIEKNIKIY